MIEDFNQFKNKIRFRVCGILEFEGCILLINHSKKGKLWLPPGGAVAFEESAHEALIREFKEECGLEIEVEEFLFCGEYIENDLHALELFFSVRKTGGELKLGTDPEINADEQYLSEVSYLTYREIDNLSKNEKHGVFSIAKSSYQLRKLEGFYQFHHI